MRRSWAELSEVLSLKLQQNDYQDLGPLLENVNILNKAYVMDPSVVNDIDSCTHELSQLLVLADESASNEEITKKLQTLHRCIRDQVDTKPRMYQQLWLTTKMKALGYKTTGIGECYGISNMAIQAFWADDMDTFNQRLQTIYDMPIEDFNHDFASLKERKKHLLATGQVSEAREISEKMIDLYAFFDGITLYQRPDIYLHDNDIQPLSKKQDLRKTMPITTPVVLEANESTPSHIINFIGEYKTPETLSDYLTLLQDHLGSHSFALNLGAKSHAVSLMWNGHMKCWLLVDPNHLPGEHYLHPRLLAKALFSDFFNPSEGLLMYTQMTTSAEDKPDVLRQFDELKTTEAWSAMHNPSKIVGSWFGYLTMEELYALAYENKDSTQWDDKKLLDMALTDQLDDLIIQLISKTREKPFERLFDSIPQKTLLELLERIPHNAQQKLIEQLSIEKKVQLLDHSDGNTAFAQMLPNDAYVPVFILNRLNRIHQRSASTDQSAHHEIMPHLQTLPNEELLSVFLKLPADAQSQCLVILSDRSLINKRNILLKELSSDQKINIIAHYRPDPIHNAECFIALLNSLPEELRLDAVKKRLYDDQTILHLAVKDVTCLRAILDCLPAHQRVEAIESKNKQEETVLHCAHHPDCLDMLLNVYPEDERLEALTLEALTGCKLYDALRRDDLLSIVVHNLPLGDQSEDRPEKLRSARRVLSVLVRSHSGHISSGPDGVSPVSSILRRLPEKQLIEAIKEKAGALALLYRAVEENPAFLSAFLNRLSESARFKMLNEQDLDGNTLLIFAAGTNPHSISVIMSIYPKNERVNVLMVKNSIGNNALYYAAEYPECIKALLNSLNIDERFEVLKALQDDEAGFHHPDLFLEVKKIMLDKIQSTDNDSGFELMKQHIMEATTFAELKVPLQELNYFCLKAKQSEMKSKVNEHRLDVPKDQTSITPLK